VVEEKSLTIRLRACEDSSYIVQDRIRTCEKQLRMLIKKKPLRDYQEMNKKLRITLKFQPFFVGSGSV
jgi:hypothetical protein